MTTDLPFEKKELTVMIHNPNNLPCVGYHKLSILQGDLKTLSEKNKGKLCKSILKHGFFIPAFVWRSDEDMYMLDATQRYHALEELERKGYSIPDIPFIEIEAKDKTDAAQKLLQITSRYGEINPKTSFFEDFNIDLDYIKDIEIPELDIKLDLLESEEIIEDEIPEVPEESITQVGDLWLCGKHRVLCGDCTKAEDVERLMQGKNADCVFTDPPYGIERKGMINDSPEIIESLYILTLKQLPLTNGVIAAFQSPRLFPKWITSLHDANYSFERALWMYDETDITYPWRGWLMCSRILLLASIGKPNWNDIKPYAHDCYLNKTAGKEEVGADHPSIKPLPIIIDVLNRISKTSNICYDPFLGPGTTLIAAEQLNRICYGMEIEPCYVDVILERYATFTGNDPVREDGKKWSELQQE